MNPDFVDVFTEDEIEALLQSYTDVLGRVLTMDEGAELIGHASHVRMKNAALEAVIDGQLGISYDDTGLLFHQPMVRGDA